jgi:hypothetical protein
MEYSSDYTIQYIFVPTLLRKWEYVYVVGFAMKNIKVAFKLCN